MAAGEGAGATFVAAAGGVTTDSGGGATGLWNILVNSPGSVDGAAGGRAGSGSGVTCALAAGDGVAGLWNILVNSPGSDGGAPSAGILVPAGALSSFAGLENNSANSSTSA